MPLTLMLAALVNPSAEAATITLAGSVSRSNCIPFGENYGGSSTVAKYQGFVYKNVPAFTLRPGDTIAWDLYAQNDRDIVMNIALATGTSADARIPDSAGFTPIVTAGTPADPNGNTTTGDFELAFTSQGTFVFGGGNLIVRFQAAGSYMADNTCTQVLVYSSGSDSSGYFHSRFYTDSDGLYPWDATSSSTIGHVRIEYTDIWYADADGDGYGDPSVSFTGAQPSGYVANSDDCDDTNANLNPDTEWYVDNDGDGYTPDSSSPFTQCDDPSTSTDSYIADYQLSGSPGDDCDDTDAALNPNTLWYQDVDNDGFLAANPPSSVQCTRPNTNWVRSDLATLGQDCDDTLASVNPNATEVCATAYDDDCDGVTDDASAPDASTWYNDGDSDGFGDGLTSHTGCTRPNGYVSNDTDCDDSLANVNPDAAEVCATTYDDDCDGVTDDATASDASTWYADDDGDNFGDASTSHTGCVAPTGYVSDSTDCDDAQSGAYPGNTEVCATTFDDDCDGQVNEDDAADAPTWYADADTDGYGDPSTGAPSCEAPGGTVADSSDCDDSDAASYPGATEVPYDTVDQDCDGADLCDVDADGFDSELCEGGEDCDDDDDTVYPDAPELADGLDNNCNGVTEDDDTDGDGLAVEQELELGTDPNNPDTDGGGVIDGDEVEAGTDPLDPSDDDTGDSGIEDSGLTGDDCGKCSGVAAPEQGLAGLLALIGLVALRRRR